MRQPDIPSVTVLIDTYNYARFLERAIESVLLQDDIASRVQVLVVDDGSSDDTAEVSRRYADRVRYISKPNGGQASALNLGIREAEGDVVCLLDGDDYFYPGKLRSVADAFRRPEVGLVYDEFEIVDHGGASLRKVSPEPTWTGYRLPLDRIPRQLRSLILLGHPWTCVTSAMSVRRSVIADLSIPEDTFPHSPDLFLGLVLPFMTEVAIIESPATAYVYHGDNVGLYRSSSANRAIHRRQMDAIRRFVEERFGVHFLRYFGQSIYGPGPDGPEGNGRVASYLAERAQIGAAAVEPVIERRCRAQLAACFVLPRPVYAGLRDVRAAARTRCARRWNRRLLETGH